MKLFRNAVSIFIVIAMLMSVMPLGVLAEDETITVVVPFEDYFSLRSDKPANTGFASSGGGGTVYVKACGSYRAFAKLNLSDYEEILRLPSTEVGVNLFGGTGYSGGLVHDFQIVTLPDSSESEIVKSKNYTQMNALGYWDAKAEDEVLFVRSDATELKGYSIYVSGSANKAALVNALDENYTNGIVQVGFYPYQTTGITDIRMNQNGYGVTITYKPSELNASSFLASYEDDFVWENISSDDVSNVENKLPTYFRGASVTWTSDKGVVSSDGIVKPVINDDGATTLTATVTYKGNIFTKDFAVTVPEAEATSVNVPFSSYGCHRSDKPAQTGLPSSGGTKYVNTGSIWKGHAQIDLSDYEEILRNPHTTVTYTLSSGNGYSTGKCYDFKFIAQPDRNDAYNAVELSYTEANALGWWDASDKAVVFERSDSTEIKTNGNGNLKGDVNKEALVNALNESHINGLVSFGIIPGASGNTSALAMGKAANYLTITYYPVEIDDADFFESNKAEFVWDNLTSDSIDNLTNDLPTYFRGGEISWVSSDGTVKNDGSLYGSKTEKLSDKITATYTYAGNTYSKEFDVTLAIYLPITITIPSTSEDSTYVNSKYPDEAIGIYEKAYDQFATENIGVFNKDEDGVVKRDRMIFFRWDLTDYEDILDVATDVSVDWSNKSGDYTEGEPKFAFTIMNNVNDTWKNSTLTYNIAVNSGMRTDPGIYTVNNLTLVKEMSIKDPGLLGAFKTALAQNPENSVISAKMTGESWEPIVIRSNSRTYDLKITYYPRDVEEKADAFLGEKFDNMPWNAVSFQDIDNVVADLDLPGEIYGSEITWTSDDESVIVASSGEVITGDTAKTVNLTASVGDKTKTFAVTVPAKDIVVKSTTVRSNGMACNGNTTEAHVYANEDVEGTPDVIVATYQNDELVNIRLHENSAIKAGFNCFYSDLHSLEPSNIVTKVIVLDDMGTLKPLAVAK